MLIQKPELLPYRSRKWKFFHGIFKSCIRLSVSILFYFIKNIYEKKLQNGWNYGEVDLLHKHGQEIMEMNWKYNPAVWIGKSMCNNIHHLDPNNKDVKLWRQSFAIGCVLLDEDSYYFLRYLHWIELTLRDQEEYRMAMHKKRAYWNWEAVREEVLKESTEWKKKIKVGEKYGIEWI